MPFHADLLDLLRSDPRLVDDNGELLIAAVHDLAWAGDVLTRTSGYRNLSNLTQRIMLANETQPAAREACSPHFLT